MKSHETAVCGLAVSLLAAPHSPPPAAKPNIIFIMADDMGWSDAGCYGGEIQTPNLDRLATNGLRFTQFYSAARCWPSRTALITGYYPQQTHSDPLAGGESLPSFVRPLPAYLKPQGYRCYHSGKWHVKPNADQVLTDGQFDRSYDLLDFDRKFNPQKHNLDDQPLAPVTQPGYYEATEIADRALSFLQEHRAQTPDRPFFLYLAFTAPHFPLQAPPADIDKYRNTYTGGWDNVRSARYERITTMNLVTAPLPARDLNQTHSYNLTEEELKAQIGPGETGINKSWVDLTAEEKAFQPVKMAIHAAMIDRMDQEIGRVTAWLEATGQLDNTLILFASDNGASSEMIIRGAGHDPASQPGSKESFLCLGPGWATTANTPFRYSKTFTYEGGVASPFIVSWPAGIKDRGALRSTQGHMIDIVPTLAELVGGIPAGLRPVNAPPLPGRSLLQAFAADADIPRDELFFSHVGNLAIRRDGWKAVKRSGGAWELYQPAADRTESSNLAAQYSAQLSSMTQRWTEVNALFEAQADADYGNPVDGVFTFSGSQYAKMADVPELTATNRIVWRMEVNIAAACDAGGVLMGSRETPGLTTTFFKITQSKGIQLYKNGTQLFRIPAVLPKEVWTAVEVIKEGSLFSVYVDGVKTGEATLSDPVAAMPCYLGGDPNMVNFSICSIRNPAVVME